MREIKFRAWSANRKCYEYNIGLDNGRPVRYGYQWFNTQNDILDSEPEQFTGLKDKDGKEIYEGDILDIDFGCAMVIRGAVEWVPPCFGVYTNSEFYLVDEYHTVQILGNIHENPELLEEAKE